ncbi:MAG: biotin--[acetyl-CoA-carboxylase] ligase [Synechococcaceae bacterium WBB_3_034]|nr:biotin--[acetyl-CoA-carboxylase] ligase [Synechococcaceae bacterium WBB_3_034]NDG23481.1 biotin--[acetyl-CoA-carboxylase] ligase [Synechococcaceae bacterium WBB_10_009]
MSAGPWQGAAPLACALRQLPAEQPLPWRLRCLPVCASTELELEPWLAASPPPLAVLADQQRFGHGQRGRPWQSPRGGVWLSAALPWPEQATAALSLAAALGLALQLEALGLQPRIKWPNDLLIGGRKLAGLLPRLRWRGGRVRHAQVGVGLNGWNRVPPGAIALAEALGRQRHPQARPDRLAARVLRGLEWAVAAAEQPELVRRQAERRLWRPDAVEHQGRRWSVQGLAADGGLQLACAGELVTLQRHF